MEKGGAIKWGIRYINYSNFNEFYNGITDYNNTYLKKFKEAYNFFEKTKIIIDYLTNKNNEPEVIINKGKLKEFGNRDWFTLKKITKFISFYFDKPQYYAKSKNRFKFKEKIFFYRKYTDYKKIYAILKNKKLIYILNYDSEENTLVLTDDIIEIPGSGHFNECIQIKDNCLLIIDDKSLYLFCKNNLNVQKFTNTNKITFEEEIYDLIEVDDKFSLISQKSKLKFINNENLKIEKVINNIDCSESLDNLTSIKDCILVNCEKGIALISKRNKELIQYICDTENEIKEIIISSDDYIYILNSLGCLLKYNFCEYNLILKEKTEIENPNEDDFSFKNVNILLKKDKIYLCNSKKYMLET